MREVDQQTDHREMTEDRIKAELKTTFSGDMVLFNDRKKPLKVTECPAEEKEWEVHFAAGEGFETIQTVTGRNQDDVLFTEGDTVHHKLDWHEPPYEVESIVECGCSSCNSIDECQLTLRGPEGGEYLIENSMRGLRVHNISADNAPYSGSGLFWFRNTSRNCRFNSEQQNQWRGGLLNESSYSRL